LRGWVRSSRYWRAVFRQGLPTSSRERIRIILANVFLHLHPTRVAIEDLRFMNSMCLGGLSFLMFLILTITGVALMFYYTPSTDRAYLDMLDLEYAVPFGMLMRNAHRWSAHAMVVLVIAHMARVFYKRAYRPPREFNWVIGVALLVLTLFLSFTGYLLPWDQLAMWAITVGTNMAKAAPFVGHGGPFGAALGMRPDNDVRFVLLGGTVVGQAALLRFYVLHCIALPLLAGVLCIVHFWRVRKDQAAKGGL
jgi:quinol-cytochrome oxidoreductase complex cytochrome b subunit